MEAKPTPQMKSRLTLIIVAVVIVSALIVAAIYIFTRPTPEDFRVTKDDLSEKVFTTQAKLAPAFNKYAAAFKQAQLKTSSVKKALQATKKEQQSYKDTETAARQAVENLKDSRAAKDRTIGVAINQYAESSEEYIDYFTSLVGDYDEYQVLFASKENVCIDILRSGKSSLSERRDKIKQAVKDCYVAIDRLENSKNVSYSEYASTLENRVKNIETYSVAVAKGEQDYKRFEAEAQKLQTKLSTLSEDASSSEYDELLQEIKTLDKKIKKSQSKFEDGATRYKTTVQELPELYENVFTKSVVQQTELLSKLVDVRKRTLTTVLDDKLLAQ